MFIKYPSIDNSYQEKKINFFLDIFPDLANCKYTIESKIDGCNIACIVKPNSEIRYASRNQLIGDLDSFFGLGTTIQKYGSELEKFVQIVKEYNKTCIFYFEYAGKGIQGRVNYGPEKFIRVFNLRIGTEIVSPALMYELFEKHGLNHILIPVLGTANSLEEALNWNCEYVNKINPESNSLEEGIVIKPLNRVYCSKVGEIFFLKKKNPKFSERNSCTKKDKPTISNDCKRIADEMLDYITESRIFSVFSKEGSIKDKSEMGKYIKLTIQDAFEDYEKDNSEVPEEYKKFVSSVASKKCAAILLKML